MQRAAHHEVSRSHLRDGMDVVAQDQSRARAESTRLHVNKPMPWFNDLEVTLSTHDKLPAARSPAFFSQSDNRHFMLSCIKRGRAGTERKITPATNMRVARCHAIVRTVTCFNLLDTNLNRQVIGGNGAARTSKRLESFKLVETCALRKRQVRTTPFTNMLSRG